MFYKQSDTPINKIIKKQKFWLKNNKIKNTLKITKISNIKLTKLSRNNEICFGDQENHSQNKSESIF